MPILIQGQIVVVHQVANEPIGGYVYLSNDQAVTINRATINEQGRVVFLHENSVIIPNARLNYIDPLEPHSTSRAIEGSYTDIEANEEDNERIKTWFASKGVKLTPT